MKTILMDRPVSAEMLQSGEMQAPELIGPSCLRVRLKAAWVNGVDTGFDTVALKRAHPRNQSIHHDLMLTPMHLGMHDTPIAQRRILKRGVALIEQGKLEILVNRTFSLEQAAAAHRLIEEGHTSGKIVLEI